MMAKDLINEDAIEVTEEMASAGAMCLLYYDSRSWGDAEMAAEIYRAMEAKRRYVRAKNSQARTKCSLSVLRSP